MQGYYGIGISLILIKSKLNLILIVLPTGDIFEEISEINIL